MRQRYKIKRTQLRGNSMLWIVGHVTHRLEEIDEASCITFARSYIYSQSESVPENWNARIEKRSSHKWRSNCLIDNIKRYRFVRFRQRVRQASDNVYAKRVTWCETSRHSRWSSFKPLHSLGGIKICWPRVVFSWQVRKDEQSHVNKKFQPFLLGSPFK